MTLENFYDVYTEVRELRGNPVDSFLKDKFNCTYNEQHLYGVGYGRDMYEIMPYSDHENKVFLLTISVVTDEGKIRQPVTLMIFGEESQRKKIARQIGLIRREELTDKIRAKKKSGVSKL